MGPARRPPARGLPRRSAVSRLGWGVAVVGFGTWPLARVLGWQELSVLATACLAALLFAVAFTFGRPRLGVRLELSPNRVTVGERAAVRVVAKSLASRRMLPLRLEVVIGAGLATIDVPSLAPGAEHDELLIVPTNRRAVVPIGPARTVRGDPLGLLRREVTWSGIEELGVEELFVHPSITRVGPLTTGRLRDLEGEATNDRSPSDVAFHTLREYSPGDDRRHIHWRTTARQMDGKLMVREFVDTRRTHVGLVLSLRPDDYADTAEFELAVSAYGSLGVRALADDQVITALCGGARIAAHSRAALLDNLSRLELGDDLADLRSIIGRNRDVMAGASVLAVVAGSGVDHRTLRAAADTFGRSARVVALRASLHETPGLHRSANTSILNVASLAGLPRLMRTVAA